MGVHFYSTILKTGIKKLHNLFWSDVWSGFGYSGGAPPPKIPRSIPPPQRGLSAELQNSRFTERSSATCFFQLKPV